MKLFSALRAWCGNHKNLTATVIGSLVNLIRDKYLPEHQKLAPPGRLVA